MILGIVSTNSFCREKLMRIVKEDVPYLLLLFCS